MHFLDKFIIKQRPLKAIHKRIIVFSAIFFAFFISTLIILFLPFKDGSAIENIIDEFYNKKWNSKTIIQLLLGSLTWMLIIWNLTLRVMDTILYKKKKRAFESEMLKKGIDISCNERGNMKLTFKQHEQYVEATLNKIINACIEIKEPLRGAIIFTIREVLENINENRRNKIEKIKTELNNYGINTENPLISRALKQI
ncbi:hypothetical protein [Mesomycoplasma molare]|uniref:Uncharacterized protein n=1 Tax=Mesomycoplasma molare TaxID=171288 RepID=A0ABY5TUW9_9BACT|nr:hypothetical protein [Mesomycoplasma molare]UWD34045.1 hypothetical protein NX772_02980 [Mesomycoplasma molare]